MKMSTERVLNNTESVEQKYLKIYYSAISFSPNNLDGISSKWTQASTVKFGD